MHSAIDALGSVTSTSKEGEDWKKKKKEEGRRYKKKVVTGEWRGGTGIGNRDSEDCTQ